MSFIEVKNVSFSYSETNNAIDDVSFNIEKGTYTTIIGHNGSGKSTIAKLIAGLLTPKAGEIFIEGVKVCEENMPTIRKKLGIVFQNPDNQFIGSTVKDDIAFGLENRRVEPSKMDDIILEYASKVGLTGLLDKEPQNMSGGQKQRVAIAGVLAMQPNVIIFDEATSMLDPKARKEIKTFMYDLSKNPDFTIVSITHDIEEVLQSEECIVLNNGKLFMQDKPENVFKHPEELRKINLDIPFIELVKEAFAKKKIKVNADNIEGVVKQLCQYRSKN
ncbi:MAG: energy-coupling factor transporter ATPase [Erysipelotrichaceae bacterium]|nr:energy-coupling factor transporter ATPase [Erysipelotrichaceae bacterium]